MHVVLVLVWLIMQITVCIQIIAPVLKETSVTRHIKTLNQTKVKASSNEYVMFILGIGKHINVMLC